LHERLINPDWVAKKGIPALYCSQILTAIASSNRVVHLHSLKNQEHRMRVFENRAMRLFGPKRDELMGS
jgi:hypothetical protein